MSIQTQLEVRRGPNAFTTFMASSGGRAVRFGIGATLTAAGVFIGPPAGYAIAVFGLLPIASGALNLCPVAPLWGGHFLGSKYCARPQSSASDEGETK
jgi:hypothetical protein